MTITVELNRDWIYLQNVGGTYSLVADFVRSLLILSQTHLIRNNNNNKMENPFPFETCLYLLVASSDLDHLVFQKDGKREKEKEGNEGKKKEKREKKEKEKEKCHSKERNFINHA